MLLMKRRTDTEEERCTRKGKDGGYMYCETPAGVLRAGNSHGTDEEEMKGKERCTTSMLGEESGVT